MRKAHGFQGAILLCCLLTTHQVVLADGYYSSRYGMSPAPTSSAPLPQYQQPIQAQQRTPGNAVSPYADYRLMSPGHSVFNDTQMESPLTGYRDNPHNASDYYQAALPPSLTGSTTLHPPASCEVGLADDSCEPRGDIWSEKVPASIRLRMRLGALALQRNSLASQAFTDGATPTNSSDFDTGTAIGYQGSALYGNSFDSGWDVEGIWFVLNETSDSIMTPIATQLFTTPPVVFAPMDVTNTYRSQLAGGEFNLRNRHFGPVTWLIGLRYINFEDHLHHKICTTGMTETIQAENQAFGLQVGVDSTRLFCFYGLAIGGWAKAGILANQSNQTTTQTLIPGFVPSTSASDTVPMALADGGLALTYRLANWISLRGGYQVMWINGVATSPSQMPVTNMTTGAASLDTDSALFYHGLFAGTELAW